MKKILINGAVNFDMSIEEINSTISNYQKIINNISCTDSHIITDLEILKSNACGGFDDVLTGFIDAVDYVIMNGDIINADFKNRLVKSLKLKKKIILITREENKSLFNNLGCNVDLITYKNDIDKSKSQLINILKYKYNINTDVDTDFCYIKNVDLLKNDIIRTCLNYDIKIYDMKRSFRYSFISNKLYVTAIKDGKVVKRFCYDGWCYDSKLLDLVYNYCNELLTKSENIIYDSIIENKIDMSYIRVKSLNNMAVNQ